MRARPHKQALLFLLTVLLPSLLVSGLVLRMLRQEHALELQAREEAQRRAVTGVGQHLLVLLERLRLEEQGAWEEGAPNRPRERRDPSVVLVGRWQDERFVLPWEARATTPASSPRFERALRAAEAAEFGGGDAGRAAMRYREAVAAAPDSASAAQARLGLARTLARSGRADAARREYLGLLALPSRVDDDQGVPFALYAADRLQHEAGESEAVLRRLAVELGRPPPLAPIEAHLLRDLTAALASGASDSSEVSRFAGELHARALRHVALTEQALALGRDLPALLRLMARTGEGRRGEGVWLPYGDSLWLVSGASPLTGGDSLIVAVDAGALLASLARERDFASAFPFSFQLLREPGDAGYPLGAALPGLRVVLGESDVAAGLLGTARSDLLLLLLPLILGVTLFTAYLLWRDVRREVRAAALRTDFVSSVTHELKTPLTSIRVYAETLRLGRGDDPQRRAEYLDTIIGESERLTRLINNVLDFSRMEEGRKDYRLLPTPVSEVVREAARAISHPLAQQGFELRVEVDEALPPLPIDRDALAQAILNLLSNAVKFSGASREIDLRLVRRNGDALIQVRDRGIGIDPREQTAIFEKFYRSPAIEGQGIAGAGLGLPLVAHVARAHGGEVELESAPGQGSTFTIRLPLAPRP